MRGTSPDIRVAARPKLIDEVLRPIGRQQVMRSMSTNRDGGGVAERRWVAPTAPVSGGGINDVQVGGLFAGGNGHRHVGADVLVLVAEVPV